MKDRQADRGRGGKSGERAVAGVTGRARIAVWGAVAVTSLVAAGLLAVVLIFDLDTGDKVASLAGAFLAAAGLVISMVSLIGQGAAPTGVSVRAGQGGTAVGGNITGSALGANSRVRTQPPASPPATSGSGPAGAVGSVVAEPGGTAAGGDVSASALGDGSQVL
ncbi:hypothetical protein [Streptomyces sp. NPDC054961]